MEDGSRSMIPARSRECFEWRDTGACKHGASCKFLHSGQRFTAKTVKATAVCFKWEQTSTCKFGSTCRFAHSAGAIAGISSLIPESDLQVERPSRKAAAPARAEVQFSRLFLTGLEERMCKKWLQDLLRPFGGSEIKLARTLNGHHRGWAQASVPSMAHATAAVSELSGKTMFEGNLSSLIVNLAIDKRDMLFPFLTYEQRLLLKLDSTALFSTTEQLFADKSTSLLVQIVVASVNQVKPSELTLTDATACAGGNTLSFARQFRHVNAVELDTTRAADLQHNVEVCELSSNVTVQQADYIKLLSSLSQDIVFVDPPWGGSDYAHKDDVYLGDMSMLQLAEAVRPYTDMLVFKLPSTFDATAFATSLVVPPKDPNALFDQRPFPFQLTLDRVVLFVICFPPRPSSRVLLTDLDGIISAFVSWDKQNHEAQKPKFYDWEKERWISLARWRGCTARPAVKTLHKPV
eukprot:GILK01009500.1.p1 GENE.GILK01009500.1~~GILK01009500.1.p1  ORF type:complete len:471 (-),score=53.94 GILK01009500.1:41-1429(-)